LEKMKKFEAGIIYQNRLHKFLIVGLFIIVLSLVISPCSSQETNSTGNGDVHNNFAFSFFDNGTIVRTNTSIFGNPDTDGDTLNDEWENAAMNELSPSYSLDRNEDFLNHPKDHVRLFGRSTPFPSPENPRYIVFWYAVTWSRDFGKYGIGAHNGDTEPFIMVWKIIDNQTIALDSVYIHAHEGCNEREDLWNASGISCNYAGICDFTLQEITKNQVCSSLEFYDDRLVLYVSKNKHALFPSQESCQSTILIESSDTWNWTKPAGSMLNTAGTISKAFWLMCFNVARNMNIFHSPFNQTENSSEVFLQYSIGIPITEDCSTNTPLRIPVFNTGEPHHLFISNLTGYGFPDEPIYGKECSNGLRFSGGLPCDGKGATPVYTWLEKMPDSLRQRLE
jgi:hypothetical protein